MPIKRLKLEPFLPKGSMYCILPFFMSAQDNQHDTKEAHSKSRFNIRLMWRMNYLSIVIFIAAVIYYIIKHS